MKSKLQKDNKGFTIIEVLIVLAIAGLILLIVFLAVPALQRNSRNTQRRNDVQKMVGTLQESANNNNGTPPAAIPGVISGESYSQYDPANIDYTVINTGTAAFTGATIDLDTVIIRNGLRCTGNTPTGTAGQGPTTIGDNPDNVATTTAATYRNFVAIYLVETQGGGVQVQCVNS